MSDQRTREEIRQEIAKKTVRYRLPDMETVPVRRDLPYRTASGADLLLDVYYPTLVPARPLPAVLLPLAYPDPSSRVRGYGPIVSWARLIAASGLAAIVYGVERPAEDVHALLAHLRTNADSLHLDGDRFGVLATSGNATVGLSAVIRDRRLRCGAFLYGFLMDVGGSTTVADMASQAGFADACAGLSPDDLPADVPLHVVRAGRDQFPGLNESLDRLMVQALARNLPVSFLNHATGAHGFDLDEDSNLARGAVRQVLSFLQLHLGH